MVRFLVFTFCLFFSVNISAQYDREDVFVDLEGEELRQAVIEEYKPSSTLGYGEARDIIFGEIDIVNDTLTCVYTGLEIYLDPALDPTTTAFAQNINTEHTYPRAKGAEEFTLGYTDMHHLYPTRVDANSSRGNLPLLDVIDNQADEWFRGTTTLTNIPSSLIDEYSEYQQNVAFEPREDHKGNVARSYFYFYTMYKSNADISDPEYFELQRENMCQWHFQDPIDRAEWNRSKNIAAVQGNENPFILDCRLARLYCDDISSACLTVDVEDLYTEAIANVKLLGTDLVVSTTSVNAQLFLYNSMGQLHYSTNLLTGESIVDMAHLPSGTYIINITTKEGKSYSKKIVR